MKHVFLDTNVIVDFILERDGVEEAADILQLGEDGVLQLSVSFLTIANTAYIVRKGHTSEQVYSFITDLSDMVRTLSMTETQLKRALTVHVTDFEDMLQYMCAKDNKCDIIITRNTKHFTFSDIPVMTPKEFVRNYMNVE